MVSPPSAGAIMPRQVILSALEREALLASPANRDELIRWYTFIEADLALIRQRRSETNRLGFAVQLCLLRFPGQGLAVNAPPDEVVLEWILRIDPSCWPQYATREETRREHLLQLRAYLGLASFGAGYYRQTVNRLCELAMQTDKGIVLVGQVLDDLRQRRVIIPSLDVIERICAEAITRANRRLYRLLTEPLTKDHRNYLDAVLQRKPETKKTWLA